MSLGPICLRSPRNSAFLLFRPAATVSGRVPAPPAGLTQLLHLPWEPHPDEVQAVLPGRLVSLIYPRREGPGVRVRAVGGVTEGWPDSFSFRSLLRSRTPGG